jgi:hypothetical protein
MSQLLVDYNRVLHALRICKRDFPAVAPDPGRDAVASRWGYPPPGERRGVKTRCRT